MPLRDYQQEDLDKTMAACRAGDTHMLGTWPTGSGKAVLLSYIPQAIELERGQQVITVVDRKELVSQLADKLAECNPNLRVDVERAGLRADASADIVVGSVQTMGAADNSSGEEGYNDRLKKFDKSRVRAVVLDEAHTTPKSDGYARILKYFGCYKPKDQYNDKNKLCMGLTATAFRHDGIGLETLFDRIIFRRDLKNPERTGLMETGLQFDGVLRPWLCGIKSYRVDTQVDISQVGTARGDLIIGALEKTVNTPERNALIVQKYRELGEDMRFFAFTVDVQHSNDLAEEFQKAGIHAYPISGSTSDKERKRIMDAFRAGMIKGLISCGVLSVGIDLPMVGCLLMARPTKSKLLYIQQTGRGLRPFPAPEQLYGCWRKGTDPGWIKPYCVTIDFVDVSGNHSLIHVPELFGLKSNFDMKGKKVVEVLEEIERLKAAKPGLNASLYTDLDKLRAVSERIDLFAVPTTPSEIATHSKFSWTTGVSEGVYQLAMPDKGLLAIRVNALGEYEIARHITGVKTPLGSAKSLAEALRLADKHVPAQAMVILRSDAAWKKLPCSEAQLSLLRRLYPEMRRQFSTDAEFAAMVNATYSRGQVSALISQRDKRQGH